MTGPFARFTDYDFRHWVAVQASLGDAFGIHRLFGLHARDGSNRWFEARDTRNELAGYVADLDIARSHVDTAAAAAPSAQLVGLQCRYALIAGSIREVAGRHLPPLAARYVRAGLWSREQALTWARLSPEPARALDIVREALREEPGDRRSELAQLAISTGATILDSDNRVLAVADLAGDLPPHVLRDALAIVAREANQGSRLGGLRRILPKLPDPLRREALAIAKAFTDPLIGAEAILAVAEALEEPARTVEIDAVLQSLRSGPRPDPSSDTGWRGVARALPLDRVREFFDFVKDDEDSVAWSVVGECLTRLAATDPDWVLAQLKESPRWMLDRVLDSVAPALASSGRHADAVAELNRISSSVLRGESVARLLMLAPPEQREPLLDIFSRRSATAQVTVLNTLVSAGAPAELLRLLLERAHTGEDALEIRSAMAPVLTAPEIDELLADALAVKGARNVIARIAPYLSLTQVHRAMSSAVDPILHDAFKALIIRLAALGEHEEALRRVQERTDILEFERAAMLAELAAHSPDAMLRGVMAVARPDRLARERALARGALVPWLPASTVDDIVEDVLQLEPNQRIEVLADLLEHITPDRWLALGEALATAIDDFLESGRYDRDVVESGFRALSGVLSRVPSLELEERALTLARSNRLSPDDHILMLVQLAAAGGEFSHVLRALTLAFEVAGDNEELVATIADGLSSAHASALAAVMQQYANRWPAAFAVAVPFLDDAAREDARRRLDGVDDVWEGLTTATGRLKPSVKVALAVALAGDTPFRPRVEQALNAIEYRPESKQAAEIAELAPWLDATQVERALDYLAEDVYGRSRALSALFQQAAVLGDLVLLEKVISRVDNQVVLADFIGDAAADLPAAALPLALAHAGHSDSTIAALAVRAATLGEAEFLMSALERINWANNMTAIAQVYRVVPERLLDTLIARAEAARSSERARALAEVIPRVADDRRPELVDKVVRDTFSLRVAMNPHRLRILQSLERELSTMPPLALGALWAEAMRGGVEWAREEAMVDIRGFARPLVAQFGPSVAAELDDAIRVAGRDEWP